ncbi:LicD family protein [Massiliimalia massiliensis]|uniref:LicD family protein n=1 Tax=Massiliimalia massiliensis TaxID=1852384 RepID=UPI00117AF401|nr:LicD family protein [Massiliimalia massiliensis]
MASIKELQELMIEEIKSYDKEDGEREKEIAAVLSQLLTELAAVCDRNAIPYYLSGDTALAAYRDHDFWPQSYTASICVHADDVLRLVEGIKKENREERTLDSMIDNPLYPYYSLRYVNNNTLCISRKHFKQYQNNGIYVTINILCAKKGKFASKRATVYKKLWEWASLVGFKAKGRKRKLVYRAACLLKKIAGKNGGKRLFKTLTRIYSGKTGSYRLRNKVYSNSVFDRQGAPLSLAGKSFAGPAQIETYLGKCYSNWRTYLPKAPSAMVDPNLSCQEVQNTLLHLGSEKVLENVKKYNEYASKMAKDNKIVWRSYAILRRSNDRFLMYQKYMPIKSELIRLHNEEKWEELNKLLQPYRSILFHHYKKGLGVCFDKEIFDITMDALLKEELPPEKRKGRKYYVQKLRTLVPDEHWKPIVIYDYKGEVIG